MNLFKGLEKFGLKTEGTENLFEEEKRTNASTEQGEAKEEIPSEESFLLEKSVRCTVCDKVFKTKMIKNGRVKRLEPDFDLRPRFMYIDTLKYDVASCPNCGYTAMNRYFEHLSSVQIKLIKEKICANFKPTGEEPAVYDYDTAINRYKLALFNTLVKKGKASEKAYTCLKISWLYRGKLEGMDEKDASLEQERRECLEQQEAFYNQAYEGFLKAVSTEMFPMCGRIFRYAYRRTASHCRASWKWIPKEREKSLFDRRRNWNSSNATARKRVKLRKTDHIRIPR